MKLIQMLNEEAGKLELHAEGYPKHDQHGSRIRGFVHNHDTNHEEDVIVYYEYVPGAEAFAGGPQTEDRISIHKVVRVGGGEIPVETLLTRKFFDNKIHGYHKSHKTHD